MHRYLYLLVIVLVGACTDREPMATEEFTVTLLASPALDGSAEAHLARGPDGSVVLSWLQRENDGVALQYSTLDAAGWLPAQTVARGEDWFVNWADFPSVVPIERNLWAAHWLAKRPGGIYSYDVAIALSYDAGESWSDPVTPHTDGTRTEHGFVSLFPWQSGVGAVWLDGRNMLEDAPAQAEATHTGSGGMTLRSVVINADRTLTDGRLIDELVCDCCQTDIALGPEGPIAVFRNRTQDEVRDIYVSRALDGEWQTPVPVANDGWEIAGCPVNGPAIAAHQSDVAIAWFTAADDVSRVRLVRSFDGAKSFSAAVDIDVKATLGRVGVALLEDGAAVVSWLRNGASKDGELCVRRVSRSGKIGPVRVIAHTGVSRASGFPQLVREGNDLIVAWTDTSGDQSHVRTARVDAATLSHPVANLR